MNTQIFLCPECYRNLSIRKNEFICEACNRGYASFEDDIVVFYGASDKLGYFDNQSLVHNTQRYAEYSQEMFEDAIHKKEFWEMDAPNKKVGITRKLWWQEHIGEIRDASILEVACGVNYLVPYWLYTNNEVTAFDICRESVTLLHNILKRIDVDIRRLNLFVADAERVVFNKKFDIINVNNALHHIEDKRKVLMQLKDCLKDEGRLLIVEPNYYYPFRWIIQTDFLERFNFVKAFFVNNEIIERGEKGIIFSEFRELLREIGLKIEVDFKDYNYMGYALMHWIDQNRYIPRLFYLLDRYILNFLLPTILAPFEYLILRKA